MSFQTSLKLVGRNSVISPEYIIPLVTSSILGSWVSQDKNGEETPEQFPDTFYYTSTVAGGRLAQRTRSSELAWGLALLGCLCKPETKQASPKGGLLENSKLFEIGRLSLLATLPGLLVPVLWGQYDGLLFMATPGRS